MDAKTLKKNADALDQSAHQLLHFNKMIQDNHFLKLENEELKNKLKTLEKEFRELKNKYTSLEMRLADAYNSFARNSQW